MKNRRKILSICLSVLLMVCLLAVMTVSLSAATEPKLSINFCNLSFRDSVCIKYAVYAENVTSPLQNVKLLIWNAPRTEYTVGTQTATLDGVNTETISGKSHVVFDYTDLTAKQMTDVVYARAYVEVDGTAYYSNINKYSILQYAYSKIGKTGTASTDGELIAMLSDMLRYGASAQKYFKYRLDSLATDEFYQVSVVGGTLSDGATSGLYKEGTTVVATAPLTNAAGENFSHWIDANGNVKAGASIEITVGSSNLTFTAVYRAADETCEHIWQTATDSAAIQWGVENSAELSKYGLTGLRGANVAATCFENGYLLECCNLCGSFEFYFIPTLSHDFSINNDTLTEQVAPTCTTPGGLRVYCNNECGMTELQNKIDAFGHDYAFSCDFGCVAGACYDCTHSNRVGTCINEYVKPGDTVATACGAEYNMPEAHAHTFGDQLYYYYILNDQKVDMGEYNGEVSCSIDYYLYKKCECKGAPYHCIAEESAGVAGSNPLTGEHAWSLGNITLGSCYDGSISVVCSLCNMVDKNDSDADGIYVGEEACQYIIDNYSDKIVWFENKYHIDFFNSADDKHEHGNCFIALGHKMVYVTVDASCTETNRIEYVCERQGCDLEPVVVSVEEWLGQVIPEAKGHNFVYEIVEAPYCTVRRMNSSELTNGKPKEEYIGRAFHPINDDGTVSGEWWIVEGHNGKAIYRCVNENCSYDCDRAYLEIVVVWNDSLHNFTNATQTAGKDDCFGAYYEWEECKICGFNKYNTPEYDERKPLDFKAETIIKTDVVKHQKHLATDSEALEWAKNNAELLQSKGLKVEDIKGAEERASCYRKGYKIEHCDICNTFFLTVSTQSHNFTSANCRREEVAATCLTPGGTRVYCVHECGATQLQDKVDAWGHNYAFTCEDGCEPGECYDCTHKNRTGVCTNEYDKPDDDTDEAVACGAEYKMPENHEHVFTSQIYYYWYENQEAVGIEESYKYTGQVSCSVDYYLYKKCECAGAPYNCKVIESAGLVPANPEKGEHTWEIVKMTIKVADCDTDGSFAVACMYCNKADTRSSDYDNDGKADGIYVGEDACKYIVDNYGSTAAKRAEFEAEYEIDFFNNASNSEHVHNSADGSTAYACFIAHGHNFEGEKASCITFGEILVCTYCKAEQGHDMVGKLDPTNHICEKKVFNVPPTCGQRELVITIYGCGAHSTVKEKDNVLDNLNVIANHKAYPRYEDGKIWREVRDWETGEITIEYQEPVPATLTRVEYKAPKCLENGNPAYYYCPECKNYLIEDANGKIVEVINRFTKDDEGNFVENVDHAKLTANDKGEAVPYLEPTYHVGTVIEVDAVYETCTDIGWKSYAFCTACTAEAGVTVLTYTRKAFGYSCNKIDNATCAPSGEEIVYHYTSTTDDKYVFSTTGIVFVRKIGDIWTVLDPAQYLYRPIPAHGTRYQVTNDEAIEPTCSTPGLTTGTHCTRCCGKYLESAKNWFAINNINSPFYVAPLGHSVKAEFEDGSFVNNQYGQWKYKNFEGVCGYDEYICCAEYSYTAVWCKWCYDMDDIKWEQIDHSFDSNGNYTVPDNGAWYIDNLITSYEHTWAKIENEEGEWILDIQETDNIPCTEERIRYKYCVYCGCTEIVEVIAPQGHYYMNGDERVPLDTSCKNNADEESDTYVLGITCDGCGKNLSEEDITHNWIRYEVSETCTEDGSELLHCSWCYSYAYEDEKTGALVITSREDAEKVIDKIDGHKFCRLVEYVAPTYEADGYVSYVCERCGETVKVIIPMLGGSLEFTSNGDGTCYVSGIGTCTDTDIVIPETSPTGDRVTGIGEWAFYECSALTSVKIPSGVTSIGSGAFADCTSLTSIKIPSSVTSIGDYAFSGCTSLESIELPSSVTSIGSYAFFRCTSLESIEIPDSVTSIGSYAFYGCTSLTSIEIPSGVTSIGSSAFEGCSSFESIEIPDSVTSIGHGAFRACTSLTRIEIPDSVTSIGELAFADCNSLVSITVDINNSKYRSEGNCMIEKTTNKLIVGCKTSIIPNNVTSIGDYAFSGCTSLTSIEIPDGVTSIGNYAFWNCISLTSITIPSSVTSIGHWAFDNCTSLTTINFGGTKAQWNAISKGYYWNNNTGNYVIHCTDDDIIKE